MVALHALFEDIDGSVEVIGALRIVLLGNKVIGALEFAEVLASKGDGLRAREMEVLPLQEIGDGLLVILRVGAL